MKLSWRDVATTTLAIFGGAIVYAKFYNLSWWLIADNWRSAIAALGMTGLVMALISGFDVLDESLANMIEMLLYVTAAVIAIIGVVVATPAMFYVLAASMGAVWLLDIGRHIWRTIAGDHQAPNLGHHAPIQ